MLQGLVMVPIPHFYELGYLYNRVNCSHSEGHYGLLPAPFKGAFYCVWAARKTNKLTVQLQKLLEMLCPLERVKNSSGTSGLSQQVERVIKFMKGRALSKVYGVCDKFIGLRSRLKLLQIFFSSSVKWKLAVNRNNSKRQCTWIRVV